MLVASKLARSAAQTRPLAPVQGVMAVRMLETYTERQEKKGRAVAPHVEIYKFPLVALSSITNRVTGVILTAGVTAIGGLSLAGADVVGIMNAIGDIAVVGHVAKFGVAFPLAFHYLGGIRHIAWDRNPEMLTNDQVEASSKAVFGAAGAIGVVAALL